MLCGLYDGDEEEEEEEKDVIPYSPPPIIPIPTSFQLHFNFNEVADGSQRAVTLARQVKVAGGVATGFF
eukprot:FN607553.1.p2 GENE.FN607553.1~~FN607553.1.p2  ORF type:complete len:69 (+),score=21.74 FN607553.1:70-276(+)